MSRDIKFRFWNKSTGTMSIPYFLEEIHHLIPWSFVDYKDMEIMQYTGLKDKDGVGVEIYEGDILLLKDEFPETETDPSEVSYHLVPVICVDGSFGVKVPKERYGSNHYYSPDFFTFPEIRDITGIEELKVIGNIYEDPELMEVK